MTHRATLVLSLCLGIVTPLGASAQPNAPIEEPVPPGSELSPEQAPVEAPAPDVDEPAASDVAPSEAPAPVEPPAPTAEEPAPVAPASAESEEVPAPPVPSPLEPAPAESASALEANAEASLANVNVGVGTESRPAVADESRCAQLFAQGQTALAQAEGCAGKEQPIYAGSQFSLSQVTAPAYRTLPNSKNGFYALNLYLAPRFRLTERWALFTDVTLGYEATVPDDTMRRHQVQATDTRIAVSGVLGSAGGITFTAAPRIIIPTSKPSWALDTYAGLGTSLGAVKNFDVLAGWAVAFTGVYTHVFSGRLTAKIREDNAPSCAGISGDRDGLSECAAGTLRAVQDRFTIAPSTSLQVNDQWSLSASYVYNWSLVKPFPDDLRDTVVLPGLGEVDVSDNPIDDTRWRRSGSFSLAVNYQPASWLIATLSGTTSVCYSMSSGIQSSLGGCSGGQKTSDFWLRNPIANKYTTVSLALTVPVDALIQAVTTSSNEKKTAKAKAKAQL